ncbi:MAG: CpaD family pilus assembly protein [Pseudomonadota bacterium]
MTKTAIIPAANGAEASKCRAMLRATLAGTALLTLVACNAHTSSVGSYDPRFLNYDQRHPLTLQQQERMMPLLVGANAQRLTQGDRTALTGFVRSYQSQGEGSLKLRVPTGSQNAHAARAALPDIHDVVASAGGHPGHVRVEYYSVGDPNAHAPIMVIYDRLAAVTNQCGQWSDSFNPPFEHSDYYDYGCASQSNLGAMLADPRDLVRPRGMGRPDAGRRAEVLAAYRRGEPTATQQDSESEAAVADVAN